MTQPNESASPDRGDEGGNRNRGGRFLRLAPHFFLLWFALWVIVSMKILVIRGRSTADFVFIAVLGVALIALSYLGAWTIWALSGRRQRIGEMAYLVIMTVLFLIPTVWLYVHALSR